MTPFAQWWKKLRETWRGEYYEGPTPPVRLAQMVLAFAQTHPHATREDWINFSIEHAGEAYKAGYIRGEEWTERDETNYSGTSPEEIADALDPDWRWSPPIALTGRLEDIVPVLSPTDIEIMQETIDELRDQDDERKQ